MKPLAYALALALALFVVSAAGEAVFQVVGSTYDGSTCYMGNSTRFNFDNGTCGNISGIYSSNVTCTSEMGVTGFICSGSDCDGDSSSCVFVNGSRDARVCANTTDLGDITFMFLECDMYYVVPDDIAPRFYNPDGTPRAPSSSTPGSTPSSTPDTPTPSTASSSTLSIIMTIVCVTTALIGF